VSFVDKTIQYANSNPEFIPPFIDSAELKKDYEAFTVLNGFFRPLTQIVKNLDDTATLCGWRVLPITIQSNKVLKWEFQMLQPSFQTSAKTLKPNESAKVRKIKTIRNRPRKARITPNKIHQPNLYLDFFRELSVFRGQVIRL
jgi:hypothetical protein